MKLREVQQLAEMTMNDKAIERAKSRFTSTVISQLMTGIEQGLQNGSIVLIPSTQNTTTTNWPKGTNVWGSNQQQTPAQTRQQKQAAAAKIAQASMMPKTAKPVVWRSGRNPNAPATTRENKHFERLNNLFEAIVNVNELNAAPQSISSYIQAQLPTITKSNIFSSSPYKEAIEKLANEVEATYASDKGQNALNKLSDFSWNSLIKGTPKMNFAGSAAIQTNPPQSSATPLANTNVNTNTISPQVAQQTTMGVRQINKLIPTLRKRDLLSVKKNVDNTLAGKSSIEPKDTGKSAFGQMAGQLAGSNKKSSTGGTITKTPTGQIHTAKPQQSPAQAAPEKDNIISMPRGKVGKVRASKEGGVTPEEQAKFDEKVRQAMASQKD